MTESALGPFRILDLSSYIDGPYCAKMLADYGADVIKIEPTVTGDVSRQIGPFLNDDPHVEKSLLYFYLNCNKRGISLNLETDDGRKIFLDLVKTADALIESFPPGYLNSLGLGYKELEKCNPGLVVASITPFGQTGPYSDYAGNDLIYYAMSGMMYASGAYDREPLKHGHPQSHYMGGMIAAYTISAALFARSWSWEGQYIDLSLQECMAAHHHEGATRYAYTGTIERRAPKIGSGSTKGIGFEGIVPAKDGFIGPTTQRGRPAVSFVEYADLLGRADIVDPKFETRELRNKNASALDNVLLPILKSWNKLDYFNTMMSQGFVAGVVQTPEDLIRCVQLQARNFYTEVSHPIIGEIKIPGEMFRLPECPWEFRLPAPMLGEHNSDIYGRELGLTKMQLDSFKELQVI